MSDFMEQGLEVFIEECDQLLLEMESSLDSLKEDPNDTEVINSLFRSAHTIKGSAGLFNLDDIVEFTHRVENVLSSVRSGEVPLVPELLDQLMFCKDHAQVLVEQIGTETESSDLEAGEQLLVQLELLAYGTPSKETKENPAPKKNTQDDESQSQHSSNKNISTFAKSTSDYNAESEISSWLKSDGVSTDSDFHETNSQVVVSDTWHISLRFDENILRNGMDPISMLQYLETMGKITEVRTLTDKIPRADDMDPESCYIGMEINYATEADRDTIVDVFQFISDDSLVWVLPPNSKITEYQELIEKLKEDQDIEQIGQLLIETKALSQRELDQALKLQTKNRENVDSEQPNMPLGEILVEQKAIHSETVNNALQKQKQVKESKLRESKYIRVDADHLDQLVDAVGELVIACEGTNLLAQKLNEMDLIESTSMVSRLVEEIRDRTLSLRMVQIGDTFKRFNRIVRDISTELSKNITLEIAGGETELDKSLVEKIGDPLTHLIRNSIDHGIETEQTRVAAGKPNKGTVRLNAFHDSGYIVIQVQDDGKGLDAEKLVEKAIEKGLIDSTHNLSQQDKFNLIMHPGLSTKEQVSNLSGRGVGMDVVRQNVESMRGTIDIESELGKGTVISMRMPLTLSIISGLLVGVGERRYVLPLDSVIECVELPKPKSADSHEGNYINLREHALPYINLSQKFGEASLENTRKNVVVVKHGDKYAGLAVDLLLGEYQTVIKPLNKVFADLSGISGSTILGDGEVALILDIPALITQASQIQVKS